LIKQVVFNLFRICWKHRREPGHDLRLDRRVGVWNAQITPSKTPSAIRPKLVAGRAAAVPGL